LLNLSLDIDDTRAHEMSLSAWTIQRMTTQFSEELDYQGEEFQMLAAPLDLWLEQNGNAQLFVPYASALRRGYIGHWCVQQGALSTRSVLAPLHEVTVAAVWRNWRLTIRSDLC
jgi:hypothetical protein